MSGDQDLKYEPEPLEDPDPPIYVPEYVYDHIGPSFTPRLILRKEEHELFRKR